MEQGISTQNFDKVININDLQELADAFYASTNLGVSISDLNQNVIIQSGWQKICTHFHQKNAESHKGCVESELFFKNNLKQDETVSYRCKNGLWDVASPVFLNQQHVATIFFGQFFYNDETIDKQFFIHQAEKYQFNLDEYLGVLKEVPILSKGKVASYIKLFTIIVMKCMKQTN